METNAKRRVLADLERDVECAARTGAPVLITADDEMSTWLAEVICQRRGEPAESLVVIDAGADLEAAVQELRRRAPGRSGFDRRRTLLIKGLHRAQRFVQRRLREMLAEDVAGRPRVIATSAADLFELVRVGAFDELLYYRLNVVHLVVDRRTVRAGASELSDSGRRPGSARASWLL